MLNASLKCDSKHLSTGSGDLNKMLIIELLPADLKMFAHRYLESRSKARPAVGVDPNIERQKLIPY